VPLDGSPLSERALPPALAVARSAGDQSADVHLMLARVPALAGSHEPPTGRSLEVARREIRTYLAGVRQAQSPDTNLTTLIPEGDVASAIVDTAAAERIELIVMSTHGYSGLTRWVLGSVTEKVLRTAPCPVLAIRTPDPIQHIAITLDGSELSERALEPGLELAQRLHADVTLLRCVPYAAINGALDEIERGLGRRMQQDLIDEAADYLATRSERSARSASYAQSGLEIKTEVRVGPAADNIYEFVETYHTDLIVMATHGRTGVQRWVYGSVTEKVLHSIKTSLMVVRPVSTTRWSMRSSE
ncbi:MAG: universal stress protein, partial [Chloroflexi bacterium]|nr:universal stress protein [Chloroflexota bacterium]